MKKRMLQFTALLLVLVLAAAVFPAAAVRAENKRIGTVTATVGLRVRDAAGTVGTNHLGWLSYGTVVTILDETTVDGVIWYQRQHRRRQRHRLVERGVYHRARDRARRYL